MLDRLHAALRELPALLDDRACWQSLDIDYHPPRVERLFRPFADGRLYLHRIHPCGPSEALFHPHPWPCAIRVLAGRYEMAFGVGPGLEPPPIAGRLVAVAPLDYEMTDPDAWHAVRPLDGPALTVMVAGAPWARPAPRADRPLRPLADDRVDGLLDAIRVKGILTGDASRACR